ncbi:NADH-quinone oxidoreductase subunit M [Nocardioides pacificus]
MNDFPWLTTMIVVPLIGAVVVAVMPRNPGAALTKFVALGFSLVTLVVAGLMTSVYNVGDGMQLEETHEWIGALGVHYAVGVDGLGLVMLLLTVFLVPVVIGAAWHDADGPVAGLSGGRSTNTFFAWILALEAAALTVFAATDVFLFYVVFEATLIPAYFLVGGFGGAGRARAAVKFLVYQLAGGLIMLVSVIGLYVISADAGSPSYLLSDLAALDIGVNEGRWLFLGFFIAFAIKAPLFPVHTWLADTTATATPGTSVLLVSILDKIGTFGMIRFCLGLFPEASQWATPVVVVIALISIVYGALVAIGQDDMLRLIGLTSLSHFGFIVLGIFVFTSQGGTGAILYMVNHGLGTAALFLVAGYLIRRRGTASIRAISGVEKTAPVLAGLFLVAGLATLGLPGLSPFVSEFMVLLSAFDHAWWAGAIAVTGIVLAAIYILWMYQRTMTGPERPENVGMPDLSRREIGAVAPLVAALLVFGFYPMPLLDVINPVVETTLEHVGVTDDDPTVPAADPSGNGGNAPAEEGSH